MDFVISYTLSTLFDGLTHVSILSLCTTSHCMTFLPAVLYILNAYTAIDTSHVITGEIIDRRQPSCMAVIDAHSFNFISEVPAFVRPQLRDG